MDRIITRKAVLKDLEKLYDFEQGVIKAERPFDPTLKTGHINYYDLEEMISASHIELVVAELNNTIIGSGYARIDKSEPYLQHDNHAYLGFMYVDPGFRGQGVIKSIVDHLINWARLQKVNEVRLEVYVDNSSAIKAYEKLGFSKHIIEMRLGLDD